MAPPRRALDSPHDLVCASRFPTHWSCREPGYLRLPLASQRGAFHRRHGRVKSAAGCAGRPCDTPSRRQRDRRRAGDRDHPDRGRADIERHRKRCIRDCLGRQEAARLERIRSRPAGALGAGVARCRTHRVPRTRVDECFRSRRARRLGGAARAVRAGAVRLALCRRDPARRGGVPGLAGDLAALAPGRPRLHRHRRPRPRRVGAGVHLRGANPRRGGGVAQRRARGDVAAAGIGWTPGFLRGRAGRTHRGVCPEHRRHARR